MPEPIDNSQTLLEEENVISLRPAFVQDNGNIVSLRLMPAWQDSSIPTGRKKRDFEWALQDHAYLYRHMRSEIDETKLMRGFPGVEQEIKPMAFCKAPVFKLLWTDSGNGVALLLNEEPWAFIDEATHRGYSKGILKPSSWDSPWSQELFEKIFMNSEDRLA